MILLKNRGVLSIKGEDAVEFLDNLLTNNIDNVTNETAIIAGLLSPQGKYLFDMFIVRSGDGFLLDCNAPQNLFKRLKMYKLRSKVEIVDLSDEMAVFADIPEFCETKCPGSVVSNHEIPEKIFDFSGMTDFIGFKDPRHDKMGNRIIAPINTPTNGDFTDYEQVRISLGVPELQQDLISDGDFALEGLMDEMGAIDFHKGCYVGQEMTSRMKRRTNVKNMLMQINFTPPTPEFNCPIKAGETTIGYVRSVINNIGMALIRIDKLENALTEGQKLLANETEIFIPNSK